MTANRAKWLTYFAFMLVTMLVILFDTRANSVPRSLALGSFGSLLVVMLAEVAVQMHRLWLVALGQTRFRNAFIRLSISYLIRVKLDDKYLLVHSDRYDQFQPVGGVFKYFEGSRPLFDALRVRDDDKVPIDENTRCDLRVRVPGPNIVKFLDWFDSQLDREIGPWREFQQELVASNLLPHEHFGFVMFRWIRRHSTGIQFSPHFQCPEIRLSEIYEALLTEGQIEAVQKALARGDDMLYLASEEEIRARGVTKEHLSDRISDSAEWTLD